MKFDARVEEILESHNVFPKQVNAVRPSPKNGPTTDTMTTKGVAGFPDQGIQTVSIDLPGKGKPGRRGKLRNKKVR
jgi:hypothetical protein